MLDRLKIFSYSGRWCPRLLGRFALSRTCSWYKYNTILTLAMTKQRHIALWMQVHSCTQVGSLSLFERQRCWQMFQVVPSFANFKTNGFFPDSLRKHSDPPSTTSTYQKGLLRKKRLHPTACSTRCVRMRWSSSWDDCKRDPNGWVRRSPGERGKPGQKKGTHTVDVR